jgi:hypothetical protein
MRKIQLPLALRQQDFVVTHWELESISGFAVIMVNLKLKFKQTKLLTELLPGIVSCVMLPGPDREGERRPSSVEQVSVYDRIF